MNAIYLDNNATTRTSPEVLQEMLPFFSDLYGNPSSMHTFGGQLHRKIEQSREMVASLIGALPEEIIFTGCGTESDNTALMSAVESFPRQEAHNYNQGRAPCCPELLPTPGKKGVAAHLSACEQSWTVGYGPAFEVYR